MSSTLAPHPDRETLLRLVDDDLPRDEKQQVDRHLEGCPSCRREMEEIRDALQDYLQFHRVWKASLPAAPRPWDRLDVLAARRAPRKRVLVLGARGWLAAAAAIAAVFLLARLFRQTPQVKAAELLRKAVSTEQAAPPRHHAIRIQSRKFHWDRPGRLAANGAAAPDGAAEIRRLLESAGYSWEDPLSAGAYSQWHDALPQKEDRVETRPERFVIHTVAAGNPVSDASLTLSPDYHAVACTLRFGASDTLEMSEIPEEQPSAPSPATAPAAEPPAPPVSAPSNALRSVGPAEELRVIAALHRIGADLGEPIDVRREGDGIAVNLTSLDAGRQQAVKDALVALPFVRIEAREPARTGNRQPAGRPAAQVDSANPLLTELQAASANGATTAEISDQLAGDTDRIVARAYALRALARRFPSAVASRLAAEDAATLNALLKDHAAAIAKAAAALDRLIQPVAPAVNPGAPPPEEDWQSSAEAMVAGAQRLDQALNAGSGGSTEARKLAAAEALADIHRRLRRLPGTL